MFFFISKVLAPLTQPLTYVFIFLVLALIFYRKPRLGKTCIGLALGLLLVFGTFPFPDMLVRYLETQYAPPAAPPQADAVVVLSGMVNLLTSTPHQIEFGESAERILTGISLVKEGHANTLVITGGSGDLYHQDRSEARLLQQFALDFGIPADRILIDPASRNTYENAVNTQAILEEHELSTLILVTSASHLPRAMACFHKLGISPIPYGVDYHALPDPEYRLSTIIPSAGALKKTSTILHEYIGILIYKLVGYI
jgi:uncharacterized SAM-binding protein YcdF (DUF218 family)